MKAKVIEAYHDKHTFQLHKVGEVLELSPERLVELEGKGKVEQIKEEKASKKGKK